MDGLTPGIYSAKAAQKGFQTAATNLLIVTSGWETVYSIALMRKPLRGFCE